jgi:bacillithiol biosynthesis cysteine-adding enzyme BshC
MSLEVKVRRLGSPQLVRDYYDAAPALAPFFAGHPHDINAVQRVAAAVRSYFDSNSLRAMADAITPTSDAARLKLEQIAAGNGFFVSTGQQAGLFTGPVFTLYKTLTMIRLASELENRLGVPVAPLFWTAADDHDFAEVNHAFVFGADNELKRLDIDGGSDSNRSMNLHLLDDSASAAVAALTEALPPTEFSQELLAWISEAYRPGNSVAGAFRELMEKLFARYDLLVTSSAHPVVKSLAVPIVLRELEKSAEHEQLVRAQTDRLLAAGYHEQVTVRAGAANVLYEDDDGRDRLARDEGEWRLSRSRKHFTDAELHEALTLSPERFSPNVHLRPVVASAVFPTLAYVGGPAEISYFAQIGCLFNAHEVPMPLAVPRASAEIVEHKVRKVLDKFALEPEVFHQPFDQLASQLMRDSLPEQVSATVKELMEQLTAGYAALGQGAQEIDPTLKSPIENARNASQKALADVEKKIVSHLKKKNEIGLEQLRKASANLQPNGQPQERVICGVSYIARYGAAFMDDIAAGITIELDTPAPEWRGTSC